MQSLIKQKYSWIGLEKLGSITGVVLIMYFQFYLQVKLHWSKTQPDSIIVTLPKQSRKGLTASALWYLQWI